MIPKSFSEHFRKTLKISLLTHSCDINAPRFPHPKIHDLQQCRCETKSKTHDLRRKTIRDKVNGWISHTGHTATKNYSKCRFSRNLRLAPRWPRITLRAYRKYALRVIGVVREPQECTKMIPNAFSELFLKTSKISLLTLSFDIIVLRFAHPKIHNLEQCRCCLLYTSPSPRD